MPGRETLGSNAELSSRTRESLDSEDSRRDRNVSSGNQAPNQQSD